MKILSGSMLSSGGSYPEITPHPSEEKQKYLYLHAFTTPIFCIHPMHPLMIWYMFLNVIDAAIVLITTDGMVKVLMTGQEETGETGMSSF